MSIRCALLFLLAASSAIAAGDSPAQRLKVSADGHSLITTDERPFFYLGDTAWELFHRLNREQAETYLADRARKGFTVVQAVVLAEYGGLTEPNAYGDLPLENRDPARPLEPYFQHVDYIVDKAASLGMRVGMLPTWGDKVNKKWGQGPEIFTPENARSFGEWLGRRYKDKPIIWILGGDRPIETEQHRLIWRALAAGLKAGDGGAHLMTYHPVGGHSSTEYAHDEPWLDFNQMQSGHGGKNRSNYKMMAANRAKQPVKPCMDGEPCYEDHPVRDKGGQVWFDEWDARKLCYWALLAGACGHTYGAHPIWQFWDGKAKPCSDPRHSWMDAMQMLGSTQVGYAKRLLLSRPFLTRVPDPSLLASVPGDGTDHIEAMRDTDRTFAMIYTPNGKPFTVNLAAFKATTLRTWWWNPRTGHARTAGDVKNEGPREFKSPRAGEEFDWVLILDDPAQNYPEPGTGILGR